MTRMKTYFTQVSKIYGRYDGKYIYVFIRLIVIVTKDSRNTITFVLIFLHFFHRYVIYHCMCWVVDESKSFTSVKNIWLGCANTLLKKNQYWEILHIIGMKLSEKWTSVGYSCFRKDRHLFTSTVKLFEFLWRWPCCWQLLLKMKYSQLYINLLSKSNLNK